MEVLAILLAGALALLLGGWLYAPVIGRVLGERQDRPTPAVLYSDGRDYVPTRTPVVFAHHFASIAGAGPIVGPVIALLYGWGPALLWVVLGGVFLGAVHDFAATHIALREGGKNLTVVARRYLGPAAFALLLVFMVTLLVLVCAAFLDLSATALTSTAPISELKLQPGQTLFRQVDNVNELTGRLEPHAVIGGIASTSVIIITACSPLVGFLYLKRKWPVWVCSVLALAICTVSILIGLRLPLRVDPQTWKGLLSIYVLLAAGLPVWLFLQSRDFINVHILYAGVVFLIAAVVAAAVRGGGGALAGADRIPLNNWDQGSRQLGPGWPVMFVTIACGAVSGFHSLCAGGTTCKQLSSEKAARQVGYYAMLLESFLAVCVICALIVGLSLGAYKTYCYPAAGKANAVLAFAMAVGQTAHLGLGLPVAAGALGAMLLLEGFLVTTLDTAVRLTRYMIEEGWATMFARYDVFAQRADALRQPERTPGAEVAGTGGLAAPYAENGVWKPLGEKEPSEFDGLAGAPPAAAQPSRPTRGLARGLLKMLKHYWVNSGLAVALMLLLGWGKGYAVLWNIFGSANQLLAGLALVVASAWLVQKARPVWYTLLPAVFMSVTSLTELVRLLATKYLAPAAGSVPLAIADVVILVSAVGVLGLAARKYHLLRAAAAAPAPLRNRTD